MGRQMLGEPTLVDTEAAGATAAPGLTPLERLVALLATVLLVAGGVTAGQRSATLSPDGGAPAATQATADDATAAATGRPDPVVPDPSDEPIPTDGAVRTGVLDNGLTYYARSNSAPGGRLEVRLVVNAGSLHEDEPGSGVAHYLEHMLFNGTERFPGNELDDFLASLGTEIGPDLNAYTTYDETVYQLSVQLEGDNTALAFDVLRDWAGAALLDPADVEDERGVVREELRLATDSAAGRTSSAFEDVYFTGSPYEGRLPIGERDGVLAVTADDLRTFYDRWYRPDNMAVVAVGDLPADRLEALIADRFASLRPRADAAQQPSRDVAPIDQTTVRLVVEPDTVATFASVDYSTQPWDASTVGGERLLIIEELIATMLRERLSEDIATGRLTLDDATATTFSNARGHRMLGFSAQGPDLVDAAVALVAVVAQARDGGFTVAELDRAEDELRTYEDQYLAAAATTQDAEHADWFVSDYLAGADLSDPDDRHARVSALLDELSLREVNGHLAWLVDQAAPVVVLVAADEADVADPATVEAAIEAARATTAGARDDQASIDRLMEAPDPVEEIARTALAPLGSGGREGVELEFANGVRVELLRSDIAEDTVSLLAVGSGGWSTLEAGAGALAPLATRAVASSGFESVDRVALDRFQRTSLADVTPFIDELEEGFVGDGSVEDVEVLFQLVHLLVTEPTVDEAALRQTVRETRELVRVADGLVETAPYLELGRLRYGDDPRFAFLPTDDQLDAFDEAAALDLYRSRLGAVDDLVVAVVGDLSVGQLEDLARTYLGTLPAGADDTARSLASPPPTGVVRSEIAAGSGSGTGGVLLARAVEVEPTPRMAIGLDLLRTIMNDRIFESVREELGASYGGEALIDIVAGPVGETQVTVVANADPERLDEVEAAMLDALLDLGRRGPTRDELDQARSILANDYGYTTNMELLQLLIGRATGSPTFVDFDRRRALLDELEASDLRELAIRHLPGRERLVVVWSPAG